MSNSTFASSANIDYELLSHIAHQTRGPFNGLIGFSDLLDSGFDKLPDTSKKEYVHVLNILACKAFLNQQTVIAWLKLISNNFSINHSSIPVSEMLNKAIQYNIADIEKTLVEITIDNPNNIDINGDTTYLNLAFTNLISFILQYTVPQTTIELSSHTSSKTIIIINFKAILASEKLVKKLELLSENKVLEIPESNTALWVAAQIFLLHKTTILFQKGPNNMFSITIEFA